MHQNLLVTFTQLNLKALKQFFVLCFQQRGEERGRGKPSSLQRGTVVSGVSCTETGMGKCSFQGCVPTRSSGLQGRWEDASPCWQSRRALRHACWVGRFNSHRCTAEIVLAGRAQAAVEPTCLLPRSPGDLWSPEPLLSSWVGMPLAASAPSPWTISLCLNSFGASA